MGEIANELEGCDLFPYILEYGSGIIVPDEGYGEKVPYMVQYLRQLRKAEGGLRDMNTAQAGDLVENLG